MFPHLARLTEAQRSAVTFDGPLLRILAGAGTGKTTTLTSRAAHLVHSGVAPERILLVTFTRRAANDMISRTRSLLSGSGRGTQARTITAGTFHSIAHRTLRTHADGVGLPGGFSVLDSSDAADLIDLVRNDCDASRNNAKRFPRKGTLLDIYSRSVNTATPVTQTLAETAPWCSDRGELVVEICRRYVEEKRRLGAIDFDDLLLYWRAMLLSPAMGGHLADAFDHVLVDEYQDVNAVQVDIVAGLTARDSHLTVVGDDCQAIYGFRGARPEHLLNMESRFGDLETILLEDNHRSTQPILNVANSVADDAPAGFIGRLYSGRADGPRPRVVTCADEEAQSAAVCTEILELREQGMALRDQAILTRASHHSAAVELELSRRSIPFVKYGGLRYLEAAHVKDLICMFRIAENPRDELAWFRILQMLAGVGPGKSKAALEALGVNDGSTMTVILMRWGLAESALGSQCRDDSDRLRDALAVAPGESIASHACRLRDALVPLIERSHDNPEARVADLDALVGAAATSDSLSSLATELTVDPPSATGDLAGPPSVDEDWLTISTVHSAKGLEWDGVHVVAAADGNFPADMALGSKEGLEEERRLFYVASTRARVHLDFFVPLRFHVHGHSGDRHILAQRSRFLSPTVMEHVDVAQAIHPGPTIDRSVDARSVVDLDLEHLWA